MSAAATSAPPLPPPPPGRQNPLDRASDVSSGRESAEESDDEEVSQTPPRAKKIDKVCLLPARYFPY